MTDNRWLLIAIRPYHAARIWSGKKPYEFRRRSLNLSTGDLVLVYETSPVCAVTGTFSVGKLLRGNPSHVVRLEPDLEEQRTVLDYLSGAKIATAIEIVGAQRRVSLPLEALGLRRAPQSYQRLSGLQSEVLRLIG
jgi:predicted transcriptional regulator